MKKILIIPSFFLLTIASSSFSQDLPQDHTQLPSTVNATIDPDDQQINKDEGYGPNDVEYNEAEGEKADEPKDATERK